MPSHPHADHAAVPPGEPGAVDSLIRQTRRLRGQVEGLRQEAVPGEAGEEGHWHRALYEFALRRLDEVGDQLGQLRDDLGTAPADAADEETAESDEGAAFAAWSRAEPGTPAPRVRSGSAEWNLLTDEVHWSRELFRIFGRTAGDGPLTLDELPSWLYADDQEALTAMVTGCLVDGRPINGEFRIVRPDGSVRAVHMAGEPVPDEDGCTASLWAVFRDVSELRRTRETLRESRASLDRRRSAERAERRLAVESQECVLPPWREPLTFPPGGGAPALDLAAHYLPSATPALVGGDWYDAMRLAGGATLLTVGGLTGHGVTATTQMAMLLGAVRGLALAGVGPDELLARLAELLDRAAQPTLASALCCRYDPADRTLTWSQAGHPAPLLFRDGVGRALDRPDGMLLGAGGVAFGRRTERLRAGDLLLLHTGGLLPGRPGAVRGDGGLGPLLALGPRFAGAGSAQECVRAVVEELGAPGREEDACVLIARIG